MSFVIIFVYVRGWVILINCASHFVINIVLGLVDIRVKYYSYYFFSYLNIIFLIKCRVVNYHPVFIVVIYFILLDCILFYFWSFFVGPKAQIRPKNA